MCWIKSGKLIFPCLPLSEISRITYIHIFIVFLSEGLSIHYIKIRKDFLKDLKGLSDSTPKAGSDRLKISIKSLDSSLKIISLSQISPVKYWSGHFDPFYIESEYQSKVLSSWTMKSFVVNLSGVWHSGAFYSFNWNVCLKGVENEDRVPKGKKRRTSGLGKGILKSLQGVHMKHQGRKPFNQFIPPCQKF